MLSVDPLKLVQFFDNLITQVQEETKAACEKAIEQGMDEEEARTAIRNITLQ